MAFTLLKVGIAVFVITFASWLSGKKPELAGFITALPLVSILAIAFSFQEHQDLTATTQYARSIIVAVPVSWLFFAPFFLPEKWQPGFWPSWAIGLLLLAGGYFIHQWAMGFLRQL